MRRTKDVRTLCASCRAEYWEAGYRTISLHSRTKEECDKCRVRMGWTYYIVREDDDKSFKKGKRLKKK